MEMQVHGRGGGGSAPSPQNCAACLFAAASFALSQFIVFNNIYTKFVAGLVLHSSASLPAVFDCSL